jgi:hypothetical protein
MLWNPHGFHVVTILPAEQSFHSEWNADSNLGSLMNAFLELARNPSKQLLAYFDTVGLHTSDLTYPFFNQSPLKTIYHEW